MIAVTPQENQLEVGRQETHYVHLRLLHPALLQSTSLIYLRWFLESRATPIDPPAIIEDVSGSAGPRWDNLPS
jgi:hypothetical protein